MLDMDGMDEIILFGFCLCNVGSSYLPRSDTKKINSNSHFPILSSDVLWYLKIINLMKIKISGEYVFQPTIADLSDRFLSLINTSRIIIFNLCFSALTSPINSLQAKNSAEWSKLLAKITNSPATCSKKFEKSREYPIVSIILVHHNRGQFLKQAIESFEAQIYPNIEVILVDEGSTDKVSNSINS